MSSEKAAARRQVPWLKIGVVAVVLIVIAVVVWRSSNPRELFDRGMATVREAGPVAFFTAAALLPAAGVPVLAFALTAGSAFGPQLGMPAVVAYSILALIVNMALTHWLARRALRPLLKRLMTRFGYKLKPVGEENVTDLVMLLRLTPGIPFCAQNYLLGLAEAPFVKYMVVSSILACPQNAAFVLFGDALLNGKGQMALLAGTGLAAAAVATRLARKHYAKKKAGSEHG